MTAIIIIMIAAHHRPAVTVPVSSHFLTTAKVTALAQLQEVPQRHGEPAYFAI